MWKPEHRLAADRSGLRYPSDLTDAEWAIVEPMIPPARHGGRKRSVNVREVLNGILYILWTGCQWKALPKDLPPKAHGCRVFDVRSSPNSGARADIQPLRLSANSGLMHRSKSLDSHLAMCVFEPWRRGSTARRRRR